MKIMKVNCQLSKEEVLSLVENELSRRGLKWSEMTAIITPGQYNDDPPYFDGVSFQVDI